MTRRHSRNPVKDPSLCEYTGCATKKGKVTSDELSKLGLCPKHLKEAREHLRRSAR